MAGGTRIIDLTKSRRNEPLRCEGSTLGVVYRSVENRIGARREALTSSDREGNEKGRKAKGRKNRKRKEEKVTTVALELFTK